MKNNRPLLNILTLLTCLSFCAYLGVTIYHIASLNMARISAHTLSINMLISPIVLWPLAKFALTQLAVYAFAIFIVYYITVAISESCRLSENNTYVLGLIFWFNCFLLAITSNSLFFNYSRFALTQESSIDSLFILSIFTLSLGIFTVGALIAFLHTTKKITQAKARYHHYLALAVVGMAGLLFFKPTNSTSTTANNQPNVILISMEALRPDFINASNMPFLSNWLTQSVHFTNAYTPIAQSFPAWVSVITGNTPKHHGARSIFTNYANINLKDNLIKRLHHAGYDSFYAVDGQRFGEITHDIGFKHIISPNYGAIELLISELSDSPLINLIHLTPAAQYLLPYAYANRAMFVTYQPTDFNDLIESSLNHANKPTLLAVHFSLSHWPYRWAGDKQSNENNLSSLYRNSLLAADKQLEAFMQMLQKRGYLQHAIVVIFSDHGTGLGLSGDRQLTWQHLKDNVTHISWLPTYKHRIDTSYGYSTDILSLKQYQTLLAFKAYGKAYQPHTVNQRVSLLDITPTLLEEIAQPAIKNTDGISLSKALRGKTTLPDRVFYLENGFTTPSIAKATISVHDVLKDAPELKINEKNGLLYLSRNAMKTLLTKKQRAVMWQNWILARYPDLHDTSAHYVLLNTKTNEWTIDLESAFAKKAPARRLKLALTHYYRDELSH